MAEKKIAYVWGDSETGIIYEKYIGDKYVGCMGTNVGQHTLDIIKNLLDEGNIVKFSKPPKKQ